MLSNRGARPGGGLSRQATTPATISSTKVKSRFSRPASYSVMGRPETIASANIHGAMSGLPHGPYTVKKRSPVCGMRTGAHAIR